MTFGRSCLLAAALLVTTASLSIAAEQTRSPAAIKDPLTRARALYNERQFDAAITAAEQARTAPARAHSADLIGARAYLERFRDSGAADDLVNARDRLRRLDPQRLVGRERAEYLLGLGETLYFDNAFGAAANMFASVLLGREALAPAARDRVLDWWATAVDRETRPRPDIERQIGYQRIRDRMQEELGANPGSTPAVYWLAAAAQAQGDLEAAWDLAEAGWVRAGLAADRGTALRADLDRLMLDAIVPARAKMHAQPADVLRQEWERFKERWQQG